MKTFEKSNGEEIIIPNDFELKIEETSNNVYKIDLIDKMGRSVSNHGTNLDKMVDDAIKKLIEIVG